MPYVIHIVAEIFGFSIRMYFRFRLNVTFSHPGIINQGLICCNVPPPPIRLGKCLEMLGALSGYPNDCGGIRGIEGC